MIFKIVFISIALYASYKTTKHMVQTHGVTDKKEIWHEYILNFLGTLSGWAATYYLLFSRIGNSLDITDLILILVAYIGVTGYLPHLIINKGFRP